MKYLKNYKQIKESIETPTNVDKYVLLLSKDLFQYLVKDIKNNKIFWASPQMPLFDKKFIVDKLNDVVRMNIASEGHYYDTYSDVYGSTAKVKFDEIMEMLIKYFNGEIKHDIVDINFLRKNAPELINNIIKSIEMI